MMDNNNTNDYPILGTLVNADSSGIIARSSQIYDGVANKSVEERISDLDRKIESEISSDGDLKYEIITEV